MRIDVAKELSACVRRLGGSVLDEDLAQPRNFANADYWFPRPLVVAELKSLTEDLSANAAFNASVATLHDSWVREGLVPAPTASRTRYNLQTLPRACAIAYLDLIKGRLETSTIRKANRQLRETKEHFGVPEGRGLLLLLNDGNYLLPPGVMLNVLAHLLKGKHSSIDSVIYFSVNEAFTVPGMDRPALLWSSLKVPGREPVATGFLAELCETWMAHYSTLVPGPVYAFAGNENVDFVNAIQFHRGVTES